MGERIQAIVKAHAPALSPKTWYGMPAYAKDGNVVCFFQNAQKYKTRYATLGFSDKANLDEGRRRDDLLAVPHHPLHEFAGAGDVGSGGVPTSRE